MKEIRKFFADLQLTVRLPWRANWLALWLNTRLTLEDPYRIKDPITDDPINVLGFSMTDDISIPMILSTATHPRCGMVTRDDQMNEKIIAKSGRKKDSKREMRKKRDRVTNLLYIIYKQ